MDEVAKLARENCNKAIIAGGSGILCIQAVVALPSSEGNPKSSDNSAEARHHRNGDETRRSSAR
jgi:hypothetical protein